MAIIYDYYRIFYYVAKYQSFTRAAAILMSNQPNITRAMNNLERQLDCRLFVRSNRGVTLTPEGQKLFAHVRIAQEQLQAGEAELAGVRQLQNGYVSVGTSELALHGFLLPVLQRFRRSYPGVHMQLTNQSTPQAIRALKNGQVELAVITVPADISDAFTQFPLTQFQDTLMAGPYFSYLSKTPLSVKDLSGYPIIGLGSDTQSYDFYNRFFAQYGQIFKPDIEVATSDQILPLVKHDLGLGFLPPYFTKEALENGEIFALSLTEQLPVRNICLVKDKRRPQSIAAQKLEQFIRDASTLSTAQSL